MNNAWLVFNVKGPERMSLANSRDRLMPPMNPAYSETGGRTQDRLPMPMRPTSQVHPIVTSAVKK